MSRSSFHSFLIAAALLVLPLAAQQQDSSQPPAPPAAQQKKQDKKDKSSSKNTQGSAAQQNPFPEAQSEKAAQQAQQQNQQQNPPSAPAPQPRRGTSAADQNPFPEAESEKAAKAAQQRENAPQNPVPSPAPGPAQNGQDSSSSAVKGFQLPTTNSQEPAAGGSALNPSLGRQDTKVGNFYLQSGDWKGAYDRFLEATRADPGDADAVFGLAESARHLGNRKLAIQNYQLYLSALPNGHHARDCRKALKEMGAQP